VTRRLIFILAACGLVLAVVSAILLNIPKRPQPPAFNPASNPFAQGIYANGIVESDQDSGSNVNIYPEVSGPVTSVPVKEGDSVRAGTPLFTIDDSIQRAQAGQLAAQARAAQAMLDELKAQPRRENLAVAEAQVTQAQAGLKLAQDQYDKQRRLHDAHPELVSQDVVDTARNTAAVAAAGLDVALRQQQLTRAGAWSYDIESQQRQYEAATRAAEGAAALLAKYVVRAPVDGVVLALNVSAGNYASPQGAYATYTESYGPAAVLGSPNETLAVRCYVDEVLVQRLPAPEHIQAEMTVRGVGKHVPLEFVRVQPYVTPKIDLSNQRLERVDVRVLAVMFRFKHPADTALYPGQLVDVYIGQRDGLPAAP